MTSNAKYDWLNNNNCIIAEPIKFHVTSHHSMLLTIVIFTLKKNISLSTSLKSLQNFLPIFPLGLAPLVGPYQLWYVAA
jgi:hypothetical protein